MGKKLTQNQVVILIAPEFDEEAVIHCLCQMRQRGTAVDLIGVPKNCIVGASGLAVRPDHSLAYLQQVTNGGHEGVLLIPGGPACATHLLSDPRVHQAIKRTIAGGGIVATMSPVIPRILANTGLLAPAADSRFLIQGSQNRSDFVKSLLTHIVK